MSLMSLWVITLQYLWWHLCFRIASTRISNSCSISGQTPAWFVHCQFTKSKFFMLDKLLFITNTSDVHVSLVSPLYSKFMLYKSMADFFYYSNKLSHWFFIYYYSFHCWLLSNYFLLKHDVSILFKVLHVKFSYAVWLSIWNPSYPLQLTNGNI